MHSSIINIYCKTEKKLGYKTKLFKKLNLYKRLNRGLRD